MSKRRRKPQRVPGATHRAKRYVSAVRREGDKTTVHLTAEGVSVFMRSDEEFHRRFGRAPRPDDPLFWDPDFDEPRPITVEKLRQKFLLGAMRAGIDAERALELWESLSAGGEAA